MKFEMTHLFFKTTQTFSDKDAPSWLTCANTIKGSTADCRWFWEDHVLTLNVGCSVETDFNRITRIK